jgi:hypothetical protein
MLSEHLLDIFRGARNPPRVVNGPSLLTGIAVCASCSSGMIRTGTNGRGKSYSRTATLKSERERTKAAYDRAQCVTVAIIDFGKDRRLCDCGDFAAKASFWKPGTTPAHHSQVV